MALVVARGFPRPTDPCAPIRPCSQAGSLRSLCPVRLCPHCRNCRACDAVAVSRTVYVRGSGDGAGAAGRAWRRARPWGACDAELTGAFAFSRVTDHGARCSRPPALPPAMLPRGEWCYELLAHRRTTVVTAPRLGCAADCLSDAANSGGTPSHACVGCSHSPHRSLHPACGTAPMGVLCITCACVR